MRRHGRNEARKRLAAPSLSPEAWYAVLPMSPRRFPLVTVALLAVLAAACTTSPGMPEGDNGPAKLPGADAGTPPGPGPRGSDAGGEALDAASGGGGSPANPGSDAGSGAGNDGASAPDSGPSLPVGTALVRVHYPAGSHAVTIRGSASGLTWSAGKAMTASGNTFSVTLTGITTAIECKPLLDDTTWAIGPNYHVASGETVDLYPHFTSMAGNVSTLIATFHSNVLDDDRAIYAYLPASYAENTEATYPVVYMHDGQNLWAALPQLAFGATWNVDTTFDTASQKGACSSGGLTGWGAQPLGGTPTMCTGDAECTSGGCRTFPEAIVIGIANDAARIYEYTPTVDPTETSLGAAGGADQYIKMLVTELKPAIDSMLRTRPGVGDTLMAGSSLGGLLTAYAGLKRPDVFGRIAAISPSSWWDSGVLAGDVKGTGAAPNRPLMVYVDSGQGTVDDESDTDNLAAAYLALGYVDGETFRHVIQPGAQHSETYWAQRFPGALQLLLGSR